ncbi:hypothetical protein MW864_19890, partial [Providencia rettgeri]
PHPRPDSCFRHPVPAGLAVPDSDPPGGRWCASAALLQITTNGKLKTVLAKGAAYESFPWSAFSGRNHSLGCALVL